MSVNEEEAAYRKDRREKTLERMKDDMFYGKSSLRRLDDVLAEYGQEAFNKDLDKIADEMDARDKEHEKRAAEDKRFAALTDEEAYEELVDAKRNFDRIAERLRSKGLTVTCKSASTVYGTFSLDVSRQIS